MKNLFLLPVKVCTAIVYRIFDLIISAMRLSALNWMRIGRRMAEASLDVTEQAKVHASALEQRVKKIHAKEEKAK